MSNLFNSGKLKYRILLILLFLAFVILFPMSVLSCLPIYLFRFIAATAIKLFRRDLDKIIPTRSAVIAVDDPNQDSNWNLCVWLTLEGCLDFNQFRENFNKNTVLKKHSNGKFVHPEFQQFYHTWLGFLFWKWEANFNITDHMLYYVPSKNDSRLAITTEEDLKNIIKTLTAKPFESGKSPWEFLFLPHYLESGEKIPNKSVLIFRTHHGFCDGFAILWLLIEEINKVSIDRPVVTPYNRKNRNVFSKIITRCTRWIQIPYEFMTMMIESRDCNDWHLPKEKLKKPFNTSFTPIIPMKYIKEIKNLNNVSFTSVIMASIAGGLRNTMLEMDARIPKYITTVVAVPIPGHPRKLRNHFIFSFMKLPVGTSDPLDRLLRVEENFQKIKQSSVSQFNFVLVPLFGGLFAWMIKFLSTNGFSTALTSNFPGPENSVDFIGGDGSNRIIEMNFSAGMGVGSVGLGFCMMSYNQGMRIVSSIDESILPTDLAVKKLNAKIMDEFEMLKGM